MLCLAAMPAVVSAAIPEGPRLAYVREGLAIPNFEELLDSDQSGERWERLAVPSFPSGGFENLTWSWDGTGLAFNGPFGGGIYVLPVAGNAPRFIRGTGLGLSPAFSPDGKVIAFARLRGRRYANGQPSFQSSIWLVASKGGKARRLTPWRDRFLLVPAAFSPDDKTLLAEGEAPGAGQEIVSLPLAGGPLTLIVRNGLKPAYAPDGSRIAFVRYTHRRVAPGPKGIATGGDLFVAASDGTGVKRLTFSPARREEWPGWDPSGERLVYTQLPSKRTPEALLGTGSSVMEINPDGTCRQRLLFTYGLAYREAAWRPGAGRGLGRIEC
jgi:Tol biopolymer transport system component